MSLPVMRCPLCQSATRIEANPFYGTGMSVHRQIRLCEHCPWSSVESDELPAAQIVTAAPPNAHWWNRSTRSGHKPAK